MITHEKMVELLAKNGADIIEGLTPESAHLLHMAVGVSGEVGELIENYIDNGSLVNKIEELGDIEFYYQGVAAPFDLDSTVVKSDEVLTGSVEHQLLKLNVASAALLDAIKKYAIYVKPIDRDEVVNQMFMVRKFLTNLYYIWNIKRDDALKANMNKLLTGKNARYAEGNYSNEQAQKRADKKTKQTK